MASMLVEASGGEPFDASWARTKRGGIRDLAGAMLQAAGTSSEAFVDWEKPRRLGIPELRRSGVEKIQSRDGFGEKIQSSRDGWGFQS